MSEAAELFVRVLMALVATVSFSIIFNVPKKELLFCGVTAAAGWLFYELTLLYFPGASIGGAFAGALAISVSGRILSYARRHPVTVYLVPGIIPLVPGAYIYHTMYELIIVGDTLSALRYGVETFKIAGVIAVGIITVLSLPRGAFDFGERG